MRLLIIESEQPFQHAIIEYLQQNGFNCEKSDDFNSALEKAELNDYDCVIVDIHPEDPWLNLIKNLKNVKSNCGIIIISSLNDIDTKLKSFSLGADDYLAKPFHLSELNARIKSVIRRKKFDGREVISCKEIQVFPDEFKVLANGEELKLTRAEYNLLLYFISQRNRVVTKTALAEHLYGDNIEQTDSYDFVYSHIKNLRKRLTERGCADYIKTIYGIGYNFQVN